MQTTQARGKQSRLKSRGCSHSKQLMSKIDLQQLQVRFMTLIDKAERLHQSLLAAAHFITQPRSPVFS